MNRSIRAAFLTVMFFSGTIARAQATSTPKFSPLFDAPNFELLDQNNKKLTNKDLLGHVWIADFVFTNCAGPCPLMTSQMLAIQRQVNRPEIRFVSFSVDPTRDTPEVLKDYAKKFGADESNWSFVTGTVPQMNDVARGMNIAAKQEDDQSVTHSTRFLLVDKSGHVSGIYRLNDEGMAAQLAADAVVLSQRHAGFTTADLPIVNASLNATSGVLLLFGFMFVKRRMYRTHATLMSSAVLVNAAFLTCYVIYHVNQRARSIDLPAGLFRTCYLVMLFTHVVLAAAVLPMIVMVVTRACRRQWDRHRKLARPTFWIWLYVSVTGVLIYVLLYHFVPWMYAGKS